MTYGCSLEKKGKENVLTELSLEKKNVYKVYNEVKSDLS